MKKEEIKNIKLTLVPNNNDFKISFKKEFFKTLGKSKVVRIHNKTRDNKLEDIVTDDLYELINNGVGFFAECCYEIEITTNKNRKIILNTSNSWFYS